MQPESERGHGINIKFPAATSWQNKVSIYQQFGADVSTRERSVWEYNLQQNQADPVPNSRKHDFTPRLGYKQIDLYAPCAQGL